jgi:hypothetical protein
LASLPKSVIGHITDRQEGRQKPNLSTILCQYHEVRPNIGGKDEVLVVILGIIVAEGDQVGGGGDLVGIVRVSRAPAVFAFSDGVQTVIVEVHTPRRWCCLAHKVHQSLLEGRRDAHLAVVGGPACE